jgi:hypothetical protein
MPNLPLSALIPAFPLHWTSILHYLLLLSTLAVLTVSGDQATVFFTLVLASLALVIGGDLYSQLFEINRIFIFLMRVYMVGIPIVIAGMAPVEGTRALGVLMVLFSAPLLVMVFLTCMVGPDIGDPRLWMWCVPG